MSTDSDDGREGNGSTKIDVRVPQKLVEQINAEYEGQSYTSQSKSIRDAPWDRANPLIRLSKEILEDLETSREQREHGEIHSLDEVTDKYSVNVDSD